MAKKLDNSLISPNSCQNGIPRPDLAKLHYAATKWCETTQNMSFGPNVVDWMRFGGKSQKKIRWPELVPKRHPRTRFRNGALAATKWGENTRNMSFRLNVVDWMCFGRETRKKFGCPGLVTNGIQGTDLATVHLLQTNGAKPPKM